MIWSKFLDNLRSTFSEYQFYIILYVSSLFEYKLTLTVFHLSQCTLMCSLSLLINFLLQSELSWVNVKGANSSKDWYLIPWVAHYSDCCNNNWWISHLFGKHIKLADFYRSVLVFIYLTPINFVLQSSLLAGHKIRIFTNCRSAHWSFFVISNLSITHPQKLSIEKTNFVSSTGFVYLYLKNFR